MSRVDLKRIPLRAAPSDGWSRGTHTASICLFCIVWLAALAGELLPESGLGRARWPMAMGLMIATITTLSGLSRGLPAQNVLLATAIIAVTGSAVHLLDAWIAIPFGPILLGDDLGPSLLPHLPWAIPFLWVLFVLSSRGVGRLILRPWRKMRTYGFWLMGVTAALCVLLDLGLEPYASNVHRFWLWGDTRAALYWYRAPWINSLGWAVTVLLILAFATPSMINKTHVKSKPDYQPLWVWLAMNVLFATGAAMHQLWVAVTVIVASSIAAAVFAVKGGQW